MFEHPIEFQFLLLKKNSIIILQGQVFIMVESLEITCECFETQCLMIFNTLIVAAVLITDSRFFNNRVSVAPEY